MVVAGMFLKGYEARIVTLTGTRSAHSSVAPKFHKLKLEKNPTQDTVEVFTQAFKAFCSDNSVDKVIINRRAVAGQGAGGAGTFLLEGILLAISPATIEFVHSATIRASDRREIENKSQKPTTVDLGKAYDLAFEGLN